MRSPELYSSTALVFELCVFTQMMWDLKSGDGAIQGSREYADYCDQLISAEEAAELSAAYQEQAGIPTNAKRPRGRSRRRGASPPSAYLR